MSQRQFAKIYEYCQKSNSSHSAKRLQVDIAVSLTSSSNKTESSKQQRVLDLLKVQELEDYLRNVRGNNNTAQGLPNLPPEQQTWTSYEAILNKAMEIGKELTQLRQIKPENRTAEQEQRIAQLVNVQQKIVEDFNNFIESPEVLALVEQLNPKVRKGDLLNNLEQLIGLQDNLRNLQQKAVLLYPLILDDRIELILTTPDSPPIRRTVQVPKQQLNETIAAFRSALQNPSSDAKSPHNNSTTG
jgi:hypothetical protein